jgi:hypothetical protein
MVDQLRTPQGALCCPSTASRGRVSSYSLLARKTVQCTGKTLSLLLWRRPIALFCPQWVQPLRLAVHERFQPRADVITYGNQTQITDPNEVCPGA